MDREYVGRDGLHRASIGGDILPIIWGCSRSGERNYRGMFPFRRTGLPGNMSVETVSRPSIRGDILPIIWGCSRSGERNYRGISRSGERDYGEYVGRDGLQTVHQRRYPPDYMGMFPFWRTELPGNVPVPENGTTGEYVGRDGLQTVHQRRYPPDYMGMFPFRRTELPGS